MFSDDPRIKPYEFRGLHGRYVHIPSLNPKAKRVFLAVYGQHATLERCQALNDALSHFGDVYMVDTPGFGGMDASYKIGQYPSLDFYADHIKNIFDTVLPQDTPVTLFGISFGWQILTQFLSKYPDYHSRVQDSISFVGLMSYRDFRMPVWLELLGKYIVSYPARSWVGSKFYRYVVFQDVFLKPFYIFYSKKTPRFAGVDRSKIREYAAEQSDLWRLNDVRTHGATAWDFLKNNDLTSLKIELPIVHLGVPQDHFLDNEKVVSELRTVFSTVQAYDLDLTSHAPIAFESPKEILAVIPTDLQTYLLAEKRQSKVD